jgi:hypothetical protein
MTQRIPDHKSRRLSANDVSEQITLVRVSWLHTIRSQAPTIVAIPRSVEVTLMSV